MLLFLVTGYTSHMPRL